MIQQEKEKMFLDLNSVLVKFWIEQGRPDKEIKIELLERMLNWYKKMGYVIPDGQSKEPVSEQLEEAAEEYSKRVSDGHNFRDLTCGFIAGAGWQKEQDQPITGNNLEQEWLRYVDRKKKENRGELPALGDYGWLQIARHFAKWQKSQMPMPEDTVLFNKGVAEGRRLERQDMLKDAVEGEVIEDLHGQRYVKSEAIDGTKFKFGDKVKIIIVPEKED